MQRNRLYLPCGCLVSHRETDLRSGFRVAVAVVVRGKADDAGLDEHSMIISESIQRAVVGAWLLVKESTTLLAYLATLTASKYSSRSLRNQQSVEGNEISYLSTDAINELGLSLLDGLGRLKHMGAISESHNALQMLCEGLLRIGGKGYTLACIYCASMCLIFLLVQEKTLNCVACQCHGSVLHLQDLRVKSRFLFSEEVQVSFDNHISC